MFSLLRRPKAGYIYKFKTKPYSYQVAAFRKLMKNRGGALFMEMGTGKTKVAIDFACASYVKWGYTRVLVICPKSVVSVWNVEIRKHAPKKLRDRIEWRITNYDRLADKEFTKLDEDGDVIDEWTSEGGVHALKEWGPQIVIVDESHKIKNPSAKRTKAVMSLSQVAEARVILSGTPISKDPMDLFAQFRFVDDGIFGTNFRRFKKKYGVWGGYGQYQLVRYINLKDLKERIKPVTFQVKKEDALDLPNKTHQLVPIRLTESRKIYDKMAKDAIVKIKGQEIEAPIILTKLLYLAQITGGWMKVDEVRKQIGREKQLKTFQLLEGMMEQDRHKVVIFTRFIAEMQSAAKAAQKAGYKVLLFHGKTTEPEREQRLAHFDETDEPTVFIAQVSTGALGISLTAASEAIFYSHTNNYAEFAQATDRLHRIGQKHPVTYYHLLGRNTVDEVNWLALKSKKNVAELVLRDPRLLMDSQLRYD